jgi:hypothetical protein
MFDTMAFLKTTGNLAGSDLDADVDRAKYFSGGVL